MRIDIKGTKYCPNCKTTKDASAFYNNKGRLDGLTVYCGACHKEFYLEKRGILRDKCFVLLGNQCKRCGFSDARALQLDHIDGGGRKKRKGIGPTKFYHYVLDHPDEFQVLCANCNTIKRIENEEHASYFVEAVA